MTYEEAIKVIESNRPTSGYTMLCEALDIAKEALEKQNNQFEKFKHYANDHFWDFCSIAGCEGASNDCWKTCPRSRYNKIKSEAVKEFVKEHKEIMRLFLDDDNEFLMKWCEYEANTDNLARKIVGDTE